jgi:molecular chaperone IbpA
MVIQDPWGIFNDPFFIGWNSTLAKLNSLYNQQSNYPPYDIFKENDDKYRIGLALAGFSEKDINVTLDNGTLIITGELSLKEDSYVVHKGIATRKFTRSFSLAEYMEVTEAEFKNGLLTITIERIVPEEKKPKQIEINKLKELT